jgi:uncharacterized protein YdeI (YjbR/CyaY-like superfamily)
VPRADAEVLAPKDRAALRRWLARHHARPQGAWLLIKKKGSTAPGVTYEESVLEALCFGWIDSTAGSHDEDHYRLWYAPRKPTSGWSASNKQRVAALEEQGLLAAPGLAAIERAKANGAWDALNHSESLEEPKDLVAAFRRHRGSRANWNRFPPGARKQMLAWIGSAKRPETRAKRVEEVASHAARNERARV